MSTLIHKPSARKVVCLLSLVLGSCSPSWWNGTIFDSFLGNASAIAELQENWFFKPDVTDTFQDE